MPGLEFDVVPLSPDPVGAPARPFFRPWATWLSTALVALLVGYIFATTPGDPLDHLHWPEDSLERLAGRDMEMRAAIARAAPWEQRLYTILSGGDESVDDWVRWHEELAQSSSSPDVEMDRLILLGETGRTAAVREGVDEWEPDDNPAARRKEWITAAYLEPRITRAAGRALITEASAGRRRHRRARRHAALSLARAPGGGAAPRRGGAGRPGRNVADARRSANRGGADARWLLAA